MNAVIPGCGTPAAGHGDGIRPGAPTPHGRACPRRCPGRSGATGVFAGQFLEGLAGHNPARQEAVAAGVPANIIDAVCLSGLEGRHRRRRPDRDGSRRRLLAINMASMSLAPHAWRNGRADTRYGAIEVLDTLQHDGLTDAFEHRSMDASSEAGAGALGLSCADQDAWAARARRPPALAGGFFAGEIEPITVDDRLFDADDGIRPGTTGCAREVARMVGSTMAAGPDIGLHHRPCTAIRADLGSFGAESLDAAPHRDQRGVRGRSPRLHPGSRG